MKHLSFAFLALIGFNIFVWYHVFSGVHEYLDIYFLDVGQGDSQLVSFPDDVQILVDGGPDKSVLFELSELMPKTDKYIDLIVVTHPQIDHFGGLYNVIERYNVGAVILSGRSGDSEAWGEFVSAISEYKIPVIIAGAGDKILYKESSLAFLSPNAEFLDYEEVNESSIVLLLQSEGVKALLTGDIGFETENYLADAYDLDVDVLKVAHHGSRFSTGLNFLAETTPLVSVIQVGKNRFGHPTEATLSRLRQVGSSVYRNDKDGTVRLMASDGVIGVYAERN